MPIAKVHWNYDHRNSKMLISNMTIVFFKFQLKNTQMEQFLF